MRKITLFIALAILFVGNVALQGQEKTEKKSKAYYSSAWGTSGYFKLLTEGSTSTDFDFFMGDDQPMMATTLKGLGSIGTTNTFTVGEVGNKYFEVFLELGYSIRYYRFEKDIHFVKSENKVEVVEVENSPYEFKNTFFSWSKNKMVIGYLVVPFGIDLKFKPFDITMKASYIRYLSGKHKLKYRTLEGADFESKGTVPMGWMVGDSRQKYKIPNSEFKDYFLNKNNISLSLIISPKNKGKRMFGLGFRYDMKPLFMQGFGPNVHEVAIVLTN